MQNVFRPARQNELFLDLTQISDTSVLKYLDHELEIDDLSDVLHFLDPRFLTRCRVLLPRTLVVLTLVMEQRFRGKLPTRIREKKGGIHGRHKRGSRPPHR